MPEIDPEDIESQPLGPDKVIEIKAKKFAPKRGKIIRREHEAPKNSIDQIHVTAMDNNSVEIVCRFNRKGRRSKRRRLKIPLPDREKIKAKIEFENPELKPPAINTKVQVWFNSYVRKEIAKFFRKKRPIQPLKIKVPEEIKFE